MRRMDTHEPKVLFVEDDERLAALTTRYLERHGAIVEWCASGEEALQRLGAFEPDVVILDVMLPGANGHAVCAEIRRRQDVPIIMVSALDEESDRVLGLEGGADDYVSKPFSPRELVARVRAQARRARRDSLPTVARSFGPLALDPARHAATLDGRDIGLTPPEFDVLWALAERRGTVLSRSRLIALSRQNADDVFERAIDVQVSRVRTKLGDDPKQPRWVQTVRGVGYVFIGGEA